MRSLNVFSEPEGSLIKDYAARMGDAMVRRRAEIDIRAAHAEAEMAIKARSEFLANMNHELRTPLNAIIGFTTMLKDGENYDLCQERAKSYLDYVLQSADLLLGHINTILEVAALESGSVEVREDIIDFPDVAKEAITRAEIQAKSAKVQIEPRGIAADVMSWGDAERLGQAADQVLQSSIRSCKDGGRILVRVCNDENGWPEIGIRDNGAGHDREEIDAALNAFQEVHRGLDRSFSGLGVGYAIAKTFVEMQGGRFLIKSRKGEGTLVRILMPPLPDNVRFDGAGAHMVETPNAGDGEMREKKDHAA